MMRICCGIILLIVSILVSEASTVTIEDLLDPQKTCLNIHSSSGNFYLDYHQSLLDSLRTPMFFCLGDTVRIDLGNKGKVVTEFCPDSGYIWAKNDQNLFIGVQVDSVNNYFMAGSRVDVAKIPNTLNNNFESFVEFIRKINENSLLILLLKKNLSTKEAISLLSILAINEISMVALFWESRPNEYENDSGDLIRIEGDYMRQYIPCARIH